MNVFHRIQFATASFLMCSLAALCCTGCNPHPAPNTQKEPPQHMKTIDEVIKLYSDSLMTIPGVVGLYHGLDDSGRTCLKVMVKEKTPELEKRIPERIEGYPVVIEETGEIKPMGNDEGR
jgi:hypothetical protein